MALEFVYFDVGETLLAKPKLIPAISSVLRDFGYQVPLATIQSTHKLLTEVIVFPPKTNHSFYQDFNCRLLKALTIPPTQELVEAIFHACKKIGWEQAPCWEVAANLDIPVGILSNWDRGLPGVVRNLVPGPWNPVIASEIAGLAKPDSKFFQYALAECDIDPGSVLMVGDSFRLDILPAIKCGMHAVLVDAYDLYPHYNGARIQSLGELTECFSRFQSQ